MIEIEKSYLVKKLPNDLGSAKKEHIRQGYFSESPSPLRIRQKDDYFELTKKLPKKVDDRTTHEEINLSIKKEEFEKLWPLVTKSLEKTRYLVPLREGLTADYESCPCS